VIFAEEFRVSTNVIPGSPSLGIEFSFSKPSLSMINDVAYLAVHQDIATQQELKNPRTTGNDWLKVFLSSFFSFFLFFLDLKPQTDFSTRSLSCSTGTSLDSQSCWKQIWCSYPFAAPRQTSCAPSPEWN